MDNITHTLLALTLAHTGLGRVSRGATATLVLASSVPDLEFVTRFGANGRLAYLAAHRGPTHGPLGLALGAAMAAIVFLALRRPGARTGPPPSFPALVGTGCIGVGAHIAVDLGTSYGTRVLSPFSQVWYGVDWLPIIDLWLLVILAAGLLVARLAPSRRASVAVAALALSAGYVGLRATLHDVALTRAFAVEAREGITTGTSTEVLFSYLNVNRPAALPAALPRGTSPFTWRLITRTATGFAVTDIDVRGGSGELPASASIQFPRGQSPLVAVAARAPTARVFLDFSRFPSVEVREHANGDSTVHWYDMRFARAVENDERRPYTSPFGAWVRLSRDGAILRFGLGPG